MCHTNRRSTYLMLGVAAAALAVAVVSNVNPGFLLIVAICPLMMLFMMRSMGSMGAAGGHSGHGCAHDPTRREDHPSPDRGA
jgi:hypothetical protein